MTAIEQFQGEYRWLSNFWPASIVVDRDVELPTVEHGYVWHKTLDPAERLLVQLCRTPAEVKRLGRSFKSLRPDWDARKVSVMHELLRQKFLWNFELKIKLIGTGTRELVEGNTWNDTFWGVCRGRGRNWLGRLLMLVRTEVQ